MKKEEMEKLVELAFNGYLETAENENKIIVDLNGFDYCDECKNEDGEVDLTLTTKLNEMLINYFESNGYDVYKNGSFYAEDGQFKNVNPDTAVAIKQ